MKEWLRGYARFVVRRAWIVLVGSLLASGLAAAGIRNLVVDLDMQKLLPADHPYVALDRRIRNEFGGKNLVAIAIAPESGTVWRKEILQIVHDLTLDLMNTPGVIRHNVISLSSPYVRIPKLERGALVVELLMRDVPADEKGIQALREVYEKEPLFRGGVMSDDERAAMILADFYDDANDMQIAARVEKAVAKHRSPGVRIAVTGLPIMQSAAAELVQGERLYFLGTVASILVVLYLAFGQLQGVVIPAVTALLSTAWSMGFMGYAGIPMDPWTSVAPLIVMTVAAGHSAQMLKRYYEEFRRIGEPEEAVVASTANIGVVMMAAGGTAGSGFASLSALGIPTLTHFGLGVASGIYAAVLLELTFMVALRALWPARGNADGEGYLSRPVGALIRWLTAIARKPRAVAGAFGLVALLAVAGYPRLSTEFIPSAYPSKKVQAGKDLLFFQKHYPATKSLTILLEGEPGSMKGLEAVRLMRGLTHTMTADPAVGRTSSLADIIERTYEVFAGEAAQSGLFDDANALSQLFFLADSPAFERYVDRSYSRSVVYGFLKEESSRATSRVIRELREYLQQNPPATVRVHVGGGVAPTTLALNEHTLKGKILNIVVVLFVIFVISSLLLRTGAGGAYVVAPLAMALVVNLGLFSWFGVAFDYVGASIAAVNVGIGADYAIYFLYRLREEFGACGDFPAALRKTMETSGRAVLFVALAVGAGFAVYIPADYLGLRLMGIFIPVTMLVSCLTALSLLPALIALFRPKFIFGMREGGLEKPEPLAAAR